MKYTHTMAGAAAFLALALFWASVPLAAEARGGALTNVNTPEYEVLTNSDVVELVRAGLSPNVIRTMMLGAPTAFDASPRAIIQLKENGVPEEVIQAMIAAPSANAAMRPAGAGGVLDRELANIASGDGEAKEIALAWFLANRATSVEPLRRRLAGQDPDIRAAAALALGRLGDSESLPAIRPLIADGSANARALAAEALSLLNDRASVTAAEQAVARRVEPLDGHIRLLGRAKLAPAAEPVGRVLEDNPETANRIAAAWALGEIGRAGVSGRAALERALSADVDPRVRREAARALAKFHDARSAEALQNACRVDPEVRKTVLVSLSDYPESIGFLVEVMNIPPDQIAADEIEAARASLMRLTGRDFGLDGSGWSAWLSENGGSLSAPAARIPAAQRFDVPFDGLDALSGWTAGTAGRSSSEVDLEAWSILADSAHIPTTPPSGALSGASPGYGSLPPPPSPAGPYAAPASPFSFSTPSVDTSGSAAFVSPASSGQTPFPPSHIPEVDIPSSPGDSAGLRTWSSDPGRAPPQEPAAAAPQPGMQTWSSDSSRIAGGEPPVVAPPSSSFMPAAPEPIDSAVDDPRFSSPGLPPAAQPAPPPGGIALPPPPSGISLPPPPPGMSDIPASPDASWQSVSDSPIVTQEPPPSPPSGMPDFPASPDASWQSVSDSPIATQEPPPSPPSGMPGFPASPDASWQSVSDSPVITQEPPPPAAAVVVDPFAAGEFQEGAAWQSRPGAPAGRQASAPFPPMPFDDGSPSAPILPQASPVPDERPEPFSGTPSESLPAADSAAGIFPMDSGPGAPDFDKQSADVWQYSSGIAPESPPPASDMIGDAPAESAGVPAFDPSMLDVPAESPGDADAPPVVTDWGMAEPFTSPYFVDPEPGQVVIGDPIIFPDATTSIPDEYPQEYAPADSFEQGTTFSEPSGQYFEQPEATDPFASPYADADVFSSPDASLPPPPPAYETATPAPPPGGVMSTPPSFVDPSQPLPPVKEEGLIKAPTGKDMPPMLGEGFK